MSEFSLVIAALGLSLGHIDAGTVAVLTFAFALTSVSSTYMIAYNHDQAARTPPGPAGGRIGVDNPRGGGARRLGLPRFLPRRGSILHQFERGRGLGGAGPASEVLIDFNPWSSTS
jgi:hypothetical protein